MMNTPDELSAKKYAQQAPTDSGICDADIPDLIQNVEKLKFTDSNKVMTSASDETGEWIDVTVGPGDPSRNFKVPPDGSIQPSDSPDHECKSFTHVGANGDYSSSRNYTGAGVSDRSSSPAGRGRGRTRSSLSPVSQPGGLQGSPGESATSVAGRGRGRAKENIKEPTIADLDHNNIDTLAMYLNNDSGTLIKNWRHLARECHIPEGDRDALARAYSGGGNPAFEFFDKLRKKNTAGNIAGLVEKLKMIERNDCVLFLQRNCQLVDGTSIKDISEDIMEQLSSKLTEKSPVIKCWKNLASLYGYTRAEIADIGSTIRQPGQYSPTHLLFATINAKYPDMKISELAEKLRRLERNDVVMALEKISKEKQQGNMNKNSK